MPAHELVEASLPHEFQERRRSPRLRFANTAWNARWRLAVLSELAEHGRLVLIPVIGPQGQLLDFKCRQANPAATLVLKCRGRELAGCSLRELLNEHPHRDNGLLRAYERAFLSRRRQIFVIDSGEWRSRHDISPSSGGLTSILTDTAAVERFREGRGAFASAELR